MGASSSANALPIVQPDFVDVERLTLIEHVARDIQAHSGAALVAMTGGSALRLCHGLPRPSFDLDVDVSGPKNWHRAVEGAIKRSPWSAQAVVDRKQGGRGYTRIQVQTEHGQWGTKVDIRVCDGESHPALERADCETKNGIVARSLRHIAERKREKVLGDDYRQQGRDLYDFAWLIAAKPAAVPVADRVRFRSWLLDWSHRDEAAWLAAIRDDRALKSVAGEVVLAAVYDVIEHDAGLRYLDAKRDGATLAARSNGGAGVRLGYVIRGAEDHFVPLARLDDVHQAVAFAIAHELNARDCGEDIVQLIRHSGCRGSNVFSPRVGEDQGADQSRVRP